MKLFFTICALLLSLSLLPAQSVSTCSCNVTISKEGMQRNSTLKVQPGQTVCIKAGHYSWMRFLDFKGTAAAPIRIINCGGEVTVGGTFYSSGIQMWNCQYVVLTGSGDPQYQYGIKVTQSPGSGLNICSYSSDIEVERLEIYNTHFAGIMAKDDPNCDSTTWRGRYTMYNMKIHDNYVHHTGGEGLYIGNSFYDGMTITCNGVKKVGYPHDVLGLEIYRNRLESTAAEAIQYGCAPDAQVHHNTIDSSGFKPFDPNQAGGLQLGGGAGGDCYANIINRTKGNGLKVIGHRGNVRVFNNVITNIGGIGFFCDDRPGSTVGTSVGVFNNTIVNCGQDAIRMYNEINVNTIANNVLANVGRYYVTFQQGATATQLNNRLTSRADTLGFVNLPNADFRLLPNSPLIRAGRNLVSYGVTTDLLDQPRPATGAYDIGAYQYVTASTGARQAASVFVDEEVSAGITLYPTPCRDRLTFRATSPIRSVRLIDISGRLRQRVSPPTPARELTVSTDNLPAGTYLYVLLTDGPQPYKGKFVKE